MPRSVAKHSAATSSAPRTRSPPCDAPADTPRHYSARSPPAAARTLAKRSDAVTGRIQERASATCRTTYLPNDPIDATPAQAGMRACPQSTLARPLGTEAVAQTSLKTGRQLVAGSQGSDGRETDELLGRAPGEAPNFRALVPPLRTQPFSAPLRDSLDDVQASRAPEAGQVLRPGEARVSRAADHTLASRGITAGDARVYAAE